MIFTLAMILNELGDLDPVCNQKSQKNQEIQGVFRYSERQQIFHKNSIYVCSADELKKWDNRDSSVIFFTSNMELEEIRHVKNYCWVFRNSVSEIEISNRYMQLQAEYSYWDKEIHLDIINSCPLEKMLDYASKIIEYPIQVYDPSFRTLDTSKNHRKQIPGFQQASELGYTPPDFISEIEKRHMLPKIQESSHVIVAPAVNNPGHINLYRAHKADGQLLGYSCIFCGDDHPSQGYLDKVELVMQNLDFYFKENQKHMVLSKYMYESFLISLLSARLPIDSRIVSDRAKIVHLPLRGEFVLVQLNFNEKDHFLSYLCRLIQKYLPEHSVFVYEEYIYLLISKKLSGKPAVEYAAEMVKHLQEMLPSYHFSCCISNAFFELTSIYDAYQICVRLESMRNHFSFGQGTYTYRDWQTVLHYLQYGEDIEIRTLFMPEIYKMKLYDEEYHTHYLSTLSSYFENNCNLKQTAEALGLHRNSAANRIEKIQQLFALDLNDFKICWNVYGTLRMMELLENGQK